MLVIHRTVLRRRIASPNVLAQLNSLSSRFHASATRHEHQTSDPRLKDLERSENETSDTQLKDLNLVGDAFATIRDSYSAPKHPIILAHGLLGFEELHLEPAPLRALNIPGLHYWRGITEALAAKDVEVITASVPPSGSIERRAQKLAERISERAQGKAVNIIAGLDSRYMISQLKPAGVKVLSLTTIATPHQGSTFADYVFKRIGPVNIPKLYKLLEFIGFETGAFEQLTKKYMTESFNPRTPDDPDVRYFSYGASLSPHLTSVFRKSHHIIEPIEGANDGLVSVSSSRWGKYQGTLDDVSHLDLINWTNRLRWYMWRIAGYERNFNAIAFYLHITDMLAKEGL